MLRAKSLAWRIFAASITLMPILLGFSAFMLDRAFRNSLYSAEKESLLANSYSMMSVAEPDEGFLLLPEKLTDSRFNDPGSGLYAQIVDAEYGPVWQSISLSISPFANNIPFSKVEAGSFEFELMEIEDNKYFVSRFNTVWEVDNQDREYQFEVIHSPVQINKDIMRYRGTLAAWLGGMVLLIIVSQTLIINWGLFPLKRLAKAIKDLESGSIQELDSNYPEEIVPVIQNINLLLDSEDKQRKRYKNTLGDLAHSLKTPLSVIRSVVDKTKTDRTSTNIEVFNNSIDEQVDRMANIVNHQLSRAKLSKASFLSLLKVAPLCQRIVTAVEKVYQEKKIECILDLDENISYPAQEGDLMEIFGNLIENAFKYGKSKVIVKGKASNDQLTITIEDNGPGVPADFRGEILKRGARIDTSSPGQGIGLAVVAEIISSYDGGIHIDTSPLGGALFQISLPYKSVTE